MNNCKVCNSDKNVIVHHDSYIPESTRLLCRSCHRKWHEANGNQHGNTKLANQKRKNRHRLYFSTPLEPMTRLCEQIVYDPIHGSITYSDWLEVRT